jgi:type II secretory pathway component PulM
VPLEGQWERVNTPLRELTSRERLVAIAATAATVIAILALVLATAGRSRPAPAPGCVRAQVAGVMGATELNACGARAERLCAEHAGASDPGSRAIRESCREAGVRASASRG